MGAHVHFSCRLLSTEYFLGVRRDALPRFAFANSFTRQYVLKICLREQKITKIIPQILDIAFWGLYLCTTYQMIVDK